MSIRILKDKDNPLSHESIIIFPICIPANLSDNELTKRKNWVYNAVNCLRKLEHCTGTIEFVLTDSLDRHNRSDEDSKIDDDANKWEEFLDSFIDKQEQSATISRWDDHYKTEDAQFSIEFIRSELAKVTHRRMNKVFNKVAETYARRFDDPTQKKVHAMEYLIEEYGVFLYWRHKYQRPIIPHPFLSKERISMLRWVNHLESDLLPPLQGPIQTLGIIDNLPVNHNGTNQENERVTSNQSMLFASMAEPPQPSSESINRANAKLMDIMNSGGVLAIRPEQQFYFINLINLVTVSRTTTEEEQIYHKSLTN